MRIETPYPKKRLLTNDRKLTILLALWILDKIIMAILIRILQENEMTKFTTRKEQLSVAHKLLMQFADKNTGGVTPLIKSMINDSYIKRLKSNGH